MTEFEYNLLIIQKEESVREYLVDLFNGKLQGVAHVTEAMEGFGEFEGTIEIRTEEANGTVPRKLHIRTAGSALDYILSWECHRQHAVLLDLTIPADQYAQPKKATGMNLLKRIKRVHPEAEVIVFTDHMIQDEAIEAIQNGAFYFIPQPQILGMFVKALVSRIIQMKEAECISHVDGLTGLYNKLCFDHFIEEQLVAYGRKSELEERRASLQPLSLMLIDVDDFKDFNEKYLHVNGDEALKAIADIIVESLRVSDIKGRIGGDEYGVILPDTHHRDALVLGERVRESVKAHPMKIASKNHEVTVTVSVGVATYPFPNSKIRKLYEAADEALLFGAKKYGKDVVCGYDGDTCIMRYHDLVQKVN